MKIVLLDAQTLGEVDLSLLEQWGEFLSYPITSDSELYDRIKDAQILITNKTQLRAEILQRCPNLKLIAVTATGTDIIDVECAKKLGIEVKNVADYSTKSVAQHTLTLALDLLLRTRYYDDYCKSGSWSNSSIFTHVGKGLRQMDGKEWGIIGLGSIGKEVARIAQCFGAKISYASVSKQPQKDCPYAYKDLEDLLSSSDIISIHAPLSDKSKNLLNSQNLCKIRDGSILINVGRGGIVNEADIAKELLERELYFGADVLASEPMKKDHPFLNPALHAKMILTPHIAWAYEHSRKILVQKVLENIQEFLARQAKQ
ncbi:D-2-hydroxyacid dehydrogenase [Helicobacter mustelae]|uniref:Putative D-2-hydroxyacid dehydrogenase n=1 Tax=Helicobacter mustelae (strain ATCC 43772 / CCUG 25715 / CIP 103759 / LMG 18044 / NCTC 12198 / R85-136P) TaxID=679897 RepID=D3UHS8_HELM1|nr:D-2-hydroxyacid dehydrogenase [Helicobacter mustelae]CBG40051.1 putative D-2-hydroxyacid dehydrogenase [Helicobacter mustelae 12198]SQH71565.1 D-2-hydroxyacid dehydrogenase [Helicobacter mustelae]STP12690.1 D-2-hydroxyacid dehydrogenase [Helicobacter mustelae]